MQNLYHKIAGKLSSTQFSWLSLMIDNRAEMKVQIAVQLNNYYKLEIDNCKTSKIIIFSMKLLE